MKKEKTVHKCKWYIRGQCLFLKKRNKEYKVKKGSLCDVYHKGEGYGPVCFGFADDTLDAILGLYRRNNEGRRIYHRECIQDTKIH